MNKNVFIFFSLFLFLSGCATSTGYTRAKNATGLGYSETKLQEGVYSIQFKGNSNTSFQRTADFALLRGAEIALENGYRFFSIIGKEYDSATMEDSYSTPVGYAGYGWPGYALGFGWQTHVYQYPFTYFMIHCYAEPPPDKKIMAFDAAQIKNNIRTRYNLPQAATALKK
jgi:hypothetical protein